MKKIIPILLLLIVVLLAWFYLNKQSPQIPHTSEPTNVVTEQQTQQPETNLVEVTSNAAVEAVQQPTNEIESNKSLANALIATNIEQWKGAIKGLHKSPGLSESWDMEITNRTTGIPVTLKKNGQTVSYQARFIDISIKNENGDILEAQLHSPIMDIDGTRELGLQLCNMLGQDPTDFLAWCNKVGNNWLDAPLYSTGDHYYGFQILNTYNNENPWYINFLIMHP
jgi:hypothetical protein